MVRSGVADRAESIRGLLAPGIALLASSLLLCCLVTVPDLAAGHGGLAAVDPRLPGWAGLAFVVALAVAAVSVATCGRLGSGPPMALGAAGGVLGLALTRDVTSSAQLVFGLLVQATAVGALFGSGIAMIEELRPRVARATWLAWLMPWTGGWALLGWFALRDRVPHQSRLGVHPPGWLMAVAGGLLMAWAVLTLLLEPHRPVGPATAGWENTWAALAVLVVASGTLVMLVGFQPDPTVFWVRPVALLGTGLAVCGFVACGWLVPDAGTRAAYAAVVAVTFVGPSCLHALLLASSEASGPLTAWLAVVFAVAGMAGVVAGWRWARVFVVGGPVISAAAAVGGWAMPANAWVMCAAAAPLAFGVATTGAAGLRLSAVSRMSLRLVSLAGLAAMLLGLLLAAPLTWALGAALTEQTAGARAGGRVLLGLAFALLVVVAAVIAMVQDQGARDAVPAEPPGPAGAREPVGRLAAGMTAGGQVVGLVLAAGAGRRMGAPKALVRDHDGVLLVERALHALADGGVGSITVVVGAAAKDVSALVRDGGWLDDPAVRLTVAPDWADGMGASLRAGLRSLPPSADAVLVMLVDLPDVGAPVVRRILEHTDPGPTALARATYDGRPGHPVLLGRLHWEQVAETARGDQGARGYLTTHDVIGVECSDLATGHDVDRPDQL